MPDLPSGSMPPEEDPAEAMVQMQREMLERLTDARWSLNAEVPRGMCWAHPAGPSDPKVGPDTTIPTYVINPADVTTVLATVVQAEPPAGAAEPG